MKQAQNIIFRLDVDNPDHIKALEYLDTLGRMEFSSAGDAIATALIAYFKDKDEESIKEEKKLELTESSIGEIIRKAVQKELDDALPFYLDKYVSRNGIPFNQGGAGKADLDKTQDLDANNLKDLDDEIDWGFLGD